MSRPPAGFSPAAPWPDTDGWSGVPHRRDAAALLALLGVGLLLWLQDSPYVSTPLVLAAVALAAVSPLGGVVSVILALPVAYETVALADLRFSLLEVALVAVVVGSSLAAVLALRTGRGRARLRRAVRPWWLPAAGIAVVVAGTMSLVSAGGAHLDEHLRVYRWTILEPVAFWATCRWALQRDAERRIAAGAFVVAGAGVGIAAAAEAIFGAGGIVEGTVSRPEFLYPHSNNLAFFLERASVLALAVAFTIGGRSWWTVAACLALGGVAATFSRGAYVAVVLGVVWLIRGTRRRGWLLLAGTVVVVAGVGVLWLGGRLLDAGGAGDASTRLPIWRSSVRMALDHPLKGVGLDGFLYEYWRRYVEPIGWPERYTSHPHDLLLDVWLRLGILGLLAMATVAAAVVLAARRDRSLQLGTAPLAAAATAALVAGLGHGLVDNGYFLPDLAVMTWFLIALSAGSATGARPDWP